LHSEISVEIAAPAETVFDLARDVSLWPERLPHYRQVTIHSREANRTTVTFAAVRPLWKFGIPVWWRSECWSDASDSADLRLRFVHVGGATRGMDVTWHIRPTTIGCTVTIEHDFRRRVPLLGNELFPRVVDRFFVRPIAGRTLVSFKRLAETADAQARHATAPSSA
jgi:ribosome-associated toxin RatA of RatAB toxin-antitoxin module